MLALCFYFLFSSTSQQDILLMLASSGWHDINAITDKDEKDAIYIKQNKLNNKI